MVACGGGATWARPWNTGIHKKKGLFSSIRFGGYIPKHSSFKWRKGLMGE